MSKLIPEVSNGHKTELYAKWLSLKVQTNREEGKQRLSLGKSPGVMDM